MMSDAAANALTTVHEPAAPAVPELTKLMVHLLKGVIYRQDDERLWSNLLNLQARVREHATILLLDLVVDEAEGYAFLKSRPEPEDSDTALHLPRLIARRPLSYPVSLMLALLRKRMAESDAHGDATRVILTREDIAEMMRVFLPDSSNEVRLLTQTETTISKIVELGFLRKLKPTANLPQGSRYEVRRILKAFVDAQWLADFDTQLERYRAGASGTEPHEDDSP